jgi:hypothetical protein
MGIHGCIGNHGIVRETYTVKDEVTEKLKRIVLWDGILFHLFIFSNPTNPNPWNPRNPYLMTNKTTSHFINYHLNS